MWLSWLSDILLKSWGRTALLQVSRWCGGRWAGWSVRWSFAWLPGRLNCELDSQCNCGLRISFPIRRRYCIIFRFVFFFCICAWIQWGGLNIIALFCKAKWFYPLQNFISCCSLEFYCGLAVGPVVTRFPACMFIHAPSVWMQTDTEHCQSINIMWS